MSYGIYLNDPVTLEPLECDKHQMRGGTYEVGGSSTMYLNITYNYARHFYRLFGDMGIRRLYGMTAADSIPLLEDAISRLQDDVHSDYWVPTEGNAKRALYQLLAMAKMRPDGVWGGD